MKSIIEKALVKVAALIGQEATDTITVGDTPFETTIRVRGIVRKGVAGPYQPTTSIPVKDALILALHYSGVTGDAALKVIERAMRDAVNGEMPADIIGDKDVSAVEKKVKATLAKLPKKMREGATTFPEIEWEIVG